MYRKDFEQAAYLGSHGTLVYKDCVVLVVNVNHQIIHIRALVELQIL